MKRVIEYAIVMFFTASLMAGLDRLMCVLQHRQAPLSLRSVGASVVAMLLMLVLLDLRSWVDQRRIRRKEDGKSDREVG